MLSKAILAASLALLGAGGFSVQSALAIQRTAYAAPVSPSLPPVKVAAVLP